MEKYEELKFVNKANDSTAIIELIGEVIEDVTLKNLKKQAGDENSFDTLILEIASPGGSVIEGLMIMVWLDELSQKGKKIITIVTANAYSIASLIMLAAHYKVISKHGKVMVHNPMIPELKYANADRLLEYAAQLRDLEETLYSMYELFTGLERKEIKELMDNETYISPKEALKYGFVDEIIDIKERSYEMTKTNTKIENMSKVLNMLHKAIAKVTGAEVVDQLYYIAEGGKVEIFQKDQSTYSLKDRTDIKDGTIKIADGATLTIKNFIIENIEKGVEAKAENKTENKADDKIEDKFNEGEAPKEAIADEKIEAKIEVEDKIEDKAEIVDEVSDEKVEDKTEDKVEAVDAEEEIPAEEPIVPEEPEVEAVDNKEDMSDKFAKMDVRISALEKELKIIKGENIKLENKLKESEEIQELSAKAIDDLANGQVSNFKPKAKTIEASTVSGSIFQNIMKNKNK